MKIAFAATTTLATIAACFLAEPTSAFQLGRSSVHVASQAAPTRGASCVQHPPSPIKSSPLTVLRASREEESGWLDGIVINPLYLLPYIGFLAFAFHATSTEAPGASQAIVEQFIADPLHPGVNELFSVIFNLIGLVGVPLACILMPAAAGQRFPAAPFLLGSAFGGYGALGPYVMTRKPVIEVTQSDLGWVTKNVLENKVFNWFMVAVASSALVTTGGLSAFLTDPQGQIQGYVELFQQTAIASASSVDFAILCLTAASLIPEDLARRGVTDTSKSRAIAASTLLLPMIGATLYCALRPPLPEES